MANGHGGARPGAGRPRKREKHAGAVTRAEKQIADRLPGVVERMLELADGVTVQETDGNGAVRVYTRPPDRAACQYLIDRILGRPRERQEIGGVNGAPIAVEHTAVSIYIPDNGRDSDDPAAAGTPGDVPLDIG